MSLSKDILDYEEKYLTTCLNEINNQIKELGQGLQVEKIDIKEFNKFIWENRGSMDEVEIRSNLLASELEAYRFQR
ncbi:MAG: hypothetical protein PHW90_02225, partial [Bacilli bacterium]|nr:hypothetical protein [Bacilli bacterium]